MRHRLFHHSTLTHMPVLSSSPAILQCGLEALLCFPRPRPRHFNVFSVLDLMNAAHLAVSCCTRRQGMNAMSGFINQWVATTETFPRSDHFRVIGFSLSCVDKHLSGSVLASLPSAVMVSKSTFVQPRP